MCPRARLLTLYQLQGAFLQLSLTSDLPVDVEGKHFSFGIMLLFGLSSMFFVVFSNYKDSFLHIHSLCKSPLISQDGHQIELLNYPKTE